MYFGALLSSAGTGLPQSAPSHFLSVGFAQVLKAVSSTEHPWHQFGTGNAKTLGEDPKEAGVDVREELLKFHDRYYSANLMRLAVVGRGSLDELQAMVVEKFSPVSEISEKATSGLVLQSY